MKIHSQIFQCEDCKKYFRCKSPTCDVGNSKTWDTKCWCTECTNKFSSSIYLCQITEISKDEFDKAIVAQIL